MNAPRPDVLQRRRQILDAADEVFCEHGVHAPLELVVERAGLGRATLYRNFPDRRALLAALLDRALQALEQCARDSAARPDGLFVLIRDLAEHTAVCAPLADYWRSVGRADPLVEQAHQRIMDALMPLLRQAIAAGLCRADVGERDIAIVVDMLAVCLRGGDEQERRSLAADSARLVAQALEAPGGAGGRQPQTVQAATA